MPPVSTKQGGMCQAMPDTCKVPSAPQPFIPTPLPNIAQLVQANPGTCPKKAKVMNQPPITKQTIVTMSSGDEAGSMGGMVSGVMKGPAAFKTNSQKTKFEGQPAVFVGCVSAHNGTNANAPAGTVTAPSQTKVIVNI